VLVSEHHFVDDGYASSTLTLLGALAVATDRMWLGTNVLVLPIHHPLRLAEEALTVDALSEGRLRLGLGLGYRAADLEPFGVSSDNAAGGSRSASTCSVAPAAASRSTGYG